jgi:hypothetical protein
MTTTNAKHWVAVGRRTIRTNPNKHWVVVLDPEGSSHPSHIYLGEFEGEREIRRGVRQIGDAVRFTLVGAKRVARGFTYSAAGGHNVRTAKIAEVSLSGGLTGEPVTP